MRSFKLLHMFQYIMVSLHATYEKWFQHVKSGWSNSCVMLIIEKMSNESLTHHNALCR